MELVTLARVHLKRNGSTRGGAFNTFKEARVVTEVADDSPETLYELIISIAGNHGEGCDALKELRLEPRLGHHQSTMTFNFQSPNAHFGSPYAECEAFPALKIGERYFKLEEISV